mgnify:FL=1
MKPKTRLELIKNALININQDINLTVELTGKEIGFYDQDDNFVNVGDYVAGYTEDILEQVISLEEELDDINE